MQATTLILTFALITIHAVAQQPESRWQTSLHQDAAGFSLNLPQQWRVQKFGTGGVAVASPNPGEFVMVMPVLGRTADCASTLRNQFAKGWQAFSAVQGLDVRPTGRGVAVASFQFQGGQSRGAVMCAETGQRSAMFYAIAAPGAQFSADRDSLLAILKSFRYGGGPPDAKRAVQPAVQMEQWQEATERAFVGAKPAGWKVNGGVTRLSNTDVRTGFQISSPDGSSGLILGDVRLNKCIIPGQFSRQYTNQSPGAGTDWCPYRTGEQVAEMYALRALAADFGVQGLHITGRRPRPDLTAASDRLTAGAGASNFRNAFGEVTFEGTRHGAAVSGRLIANTLLLISPDPNLMGGNYTQDISGFLGPKGRDAEMAAIMQRVQGSIKWNIQWVMANRAAGQRDTEMVRRYMESQAQLGQQMYQDRMASADRRSAAVGDVLSGQVRLRDNEGNQYEAHAGSNYYYLNEQQSRLESNRNNAVLGTDISVPLSNGSIDLRPLEVIR